MFDGPIDAERFLAYVGQLRVPKLSKGDVVIMDNLASDKAMPVRRAIRAAGTLLGRISRQMIRHTKALSPIGYLSL